MAERTDTDKFVDKGKKLFEKCSKGRSRPLMFPPAPSQIRIDVYKDSRVNPTDTKKVEEDKKRQEDYEAEVIVYRALEQLDEPIVVLHGLEYTHNQCIIWNSKAKYSAAGQHDFVVIGPDYIVIIEVKNPKITQASSSESMPEDPLAKSIEIAKIQLEKVVKLIRGIGEKTRGQCKRTVDLFQVVAFPNVDHRFEDAEKKFILINKSDLENFTEFWNDKLKARRTSFHGDIGKIQSVLIHLFANAKNNEIETKKISLADCVVDIDLKLRDGHITFESKKRPRNPDVKKISELPAEYIDGKNINKFIFKDCLGLDFITNEQWEAYQKKSDCVIITGGPGSGKTLVLLARIIYLALVHPDWKIKFRVANHIDLVEYTDVIQKAGINIKVVELNLPENGQICRELFEYFQVVILHQSNSALSDKFDIQFIYDYQIQFYQNPNHKPIQEPFVLTVDLNQKPVCTKTAAVEGSSLRFNSVPIVQLSASYRSTRNIVSQLITLSELIRNRTQQTENQAEIENQIREQENQTAQMGNQTLETESPTEQNENQSIEIKKLSHTPVYGHFIYGPQILVQVYSHESNKTSCSILIKAIIDSVKKDSEICDLECAFFVFPRFFHRKGIQDYWIDTFYDELFTAETARGKEFISSSEFTQCHILIPFNPNDYKLALLQFLYNAIARTRVSCHIHVLVDKTCCREAVRKELRVIFPEARIIGK
ncbi:uncharacterized protein LOC134855278 isoform X2 [Symsagittifera roscoffensis]|uniref:uncharacterized protein LOC134855278 isoform X2 n=1 Tax=Symsagittifera roscoffensis TaxID=84072 RepID=UPI00307C3899